jgi:hypothetical protein
MVILSRAPLCHAETPGRTLRADDGLFNIRIGMV